MDETQLYRHDRILGQIQWKHVSYLILPVRHIHPLLSLMLQLKLVAVPKELNSSDDRLKALSAFDRNNPRNRASSVDSGSSNKIQDGSITMARAKATLCCCPPES